MLMLRVKEVVESKGHTITTLSKASGVSRYTVKRACKDPDYNIHYGKLVKMAHVLEVSFDDLLDRTSEKREVNRT